MQRRRVAAVGPCRKVRGKLRDEVRTAGAVGLIGFLQLTQQLRSLRFDLVGGEGLVQPLLMPRLREKQIRQAGVGADHKLRRAVAAHAVFVFIDGDGIRPALVVPRDAPVVVKVTDGCRQDVEHPLLQEPLLPFSGNGDALKLAVADDNGVIVAGGNAGAELLAVACLKVLFGSHKDIGGGVEPQELRRPLLRQVVRHRKEGFLAQAEALSLHGGGDHLKGLARAHLMGKERVAAVEVVGDGAPLMLPQRDLRIHARKDQVPAVIFPGTGGIEALVVELHQLAPPVRVLPYPVPERILDCLLLLLGKGGFLAVKDALFLTVRIPLGTKKGHFFFSEEMS